MIYCIILVPPHTHIRAHTLTHPNSKAGDMLLLHLLDLGI